MDRPNKNSPEIHRKVAEDLLPRVQEWCGDQGDDAEEPESILEDLTDALDCIDLDGFRIASRLDGWVADFQLAEILNEASAIAHKHHREAVKAWIAETGIRPAHAVGDGVKVESTMDRHRHYNPATYDGEIAKIHDEIGAYTVFVEALGHVRCGVGSHGLVLPWEEVDALNP